ncbi:ABC transporter ATP-binding protein [Pseudogulbenkiania subflava]|uniref:Microcin C transport system ATP-binding protein n=1 Tax=Pseudogulbenkiania subflava DSM 22618 TaxID=1123014 RepID=A0A1Y6BKQ7_9NEIS|nr:dipeptide ABC transporter ATP-binding protein [Pseudogulbenkiania subflava]SMF08305.1 microcin C transport system ATP-binding protein [Pseudogulbenkiania subflava DSM 22618]
MDPLLSVENLHARFGSRAAVRGVSFSVRAGEKVALVGESGSGKTVTAQALMRLNPDVTLSGTVRFNGEELLSVPERRLRQLRGREMAMIFQEPMSALNPVYTIGNQIIETLSQHFGLAPRAARQRAIELLARTGIPDPEIKVDAYPFQLSGGQRQRAMIAMALACQPKLLIADEPTTALDVTVQAQILALLDELQRDLGMAVLFITHDLNLVRRFADRVAVMKDGEVVETGTVAEVFDHPEHPYTRELLASRPDTLDDAPGQAEPRLQAESIRVAFSRRRGWFGKTVTPVLHGISLSVPAGRTLGIVGESGSGKTTLGLALTRLIEAEGQVTLDTTRLDTLSGQALRASRRDYQVVFQDPFASLSPRLTVGQIVGEGVALHFPELDEAARRQRVLDTLTEVGLAADSVDRYPHEFSGGQRQRIAIARALVLRPKLILLDEPTSALDATLQKQVLQLLRRLQHKYGLSYLFISHDLAVIRAVAHEVLVLKDGKVVEAGPTRRVFEAPGQPYTRDLLAAALLGA